MHELNKLRKQVLLANVLSFGCLGLGFLMLMTASSIGFILFICGMIALFITSSTIGSTYKSKYKEMICKGVIEKLFDVKIYDPHNGFTKDFVRSTYLIPIGNRYKSDDYISGSYKGINFERSDVCMQDHRSNGKTSTTVTLFEGSWTTFTFPKNVSSYIMIRENEFLSNGRPGGIFSDAPMTSKVTFEDIDFNDRFSVYAQDEHDAFYVCTPQFIEKIKELESKFDGRLTIGIIHQKVHVLFYNNENAMEPSIINEISEDDFIKVENEMNQIIEIMNALDLIRKE